MGAVREGGKDGEVARRYTPESGGRRAGRQLRRGLAALHALGDPPHFFDQRQTALADRKAEALRVGVARGDDRDAENILQHGGDMQGAVAFTGADIHINPLQAQVEGVEQHGAQDGAVHSRQVLVTLVYGQKKLRFVEVNNCRLRLVELADDFQWRHADYADLFAHVQ